MARQRIWFASIAVVVLGIPFLIYGALSFDIGARQKPGKLETYVAMKAKRWFVARAVARTGVSAADRQLSVSRGRALYDSCCSACLGPSDPTSAELDVGLT